MALIGTAEAAKILGVSPARIRRLILDDRFPGAVKISGVNLVDESKIRGFQRKKPGPKPVKKI